MSPSFETPLGFPAPEPLKPWRFPPIREERLTSGQRVWLCDLPDSPLVTAMLVMPIPLSLEPRGKEGITAAMAAALLEGPRSCTQAEFVEAIESAGASLTHFHSPMGIEVSLTIAASRLEEGLKLLALLVEEPALREEAVERARQAALESLEFSMQDPESLAGLLRDSILFEKGSRESLPIMGTKESVESLRREEVEEYWQKYIAAGNSTLVLCGEVGGYDVLASIQEAFANWNGAAIPLTATPPRTAKRRVVLYDFPGAVQTAVQIARVTKSQSEAEGFVAGEIADFALGGNMDGRLFQKLREEKGYTYGVRSKTEDFGTYAVRHIGTSVSADVTNDALVEALAETKRLAAEGLGQEELQLARTGLTAAPRRWESPEAFAEYFAGCAALGLPASYPQKHLEEALRVSLEEVNVAAAKDWALENLSVALGGDAEGFEKQRGPNFPELEVITELF